MLSRARWFKSDRLWNSLRSLSCSYLFCFVVELSYLWTQGEQRHFFFFITVCLLLSPAFPKCGTWSCGTEMPPLLVKSVDLQLRPAYSTFSFPASFYYWRFSRPVDLGMNLAFWDLQDARFVLLKISGVTRELWLTGRESPFPSLFIFGTATVHTRVPHKLNFSLSHLLQPGSVLHALFSFET